MAFIQESSNMKMEEIHKYFETVSKILRIRSIDTRSDIEASITHSRGWVHEPKDKRIVMQSGSGVS